MLRNWLAHPQTRGLDLDSPETTALRAAILQEKTFLKSIYLDWYRYQVSCLPPLPGSVLEVGSGGGFLKQVLPEALSSEIFYLSGLDAVLDGQRLPFAATSLRAILMTNVFHHIPNVERFLREASRVVRVGGTLSMIEPWHTPWSRLIYQRLHHEPFDPDIQEWHLPSGGPLSGANGALPWMVFERDQEKFKQLFPEWQVELIQPIMPITYLLSGGISLRVSMPGWSYRAWQLLEQLATPWMGKLGMFARICLRRV